ncbi:MAG TPA: hypothetical protein VHR42_07630 [Clostridia bacterium]|nr:hypothetical protein [Clostridia bacterium]
MLTENNYEKRYCPDRKKSRLSKWEKCLHHPALLREAEISEAFYELLVTIEENNWSGACHSASAILYVLFSELEIHAELCVGEVQFDTTIIDHSWVEANTEIYDASIYRGICGISLSPPVFRSLNIETQKPADGVYGIAKDGIGETARSILSVSLSDYMDHYTVCENGLWNYVREIGNRVGLSVDISRLRQKYKTTAWKYKKNLI